MSAGRFLARVTAVPVIALTAWLLVAFPLLYFGVFTPITGALVALPVVLAAIAIVARLLPDLPEEDTPWWPVAAVLLITALFAIVQILYHSEQIIIRRDAASYAQFTIWIAQHGSLPIPQQRGLLAGGDPALTYDSLAYYQVGDVIWPQFFSGAPLTYSIGHWLGGVQAMLVTPPVLGALGVLTFAGLAARLIGARWAPLAALLLAVCLPEQWISRSTYSEPPAQILLIGALLLAFDALARHKGLRDRFGGAHLLALAAGLAFGLGLVVRVDALRDILPVAVFIGLLLLARRGQALPMLAGLALGVVYGYFAGWELSRPYLEYLSASVVPLLVASGVIVGATALGVAVFWRRGLASRVRPTWLPTAVGVFAVVVMIGFAVRPLVYVQHGHGSPATGAWVAAVQRIEGLPIDPTRTYEEMSLYWVGWYVGLTTIVLATIGVALLIRRTLRGGAPQWGLPLMVLVWTVATTLVRPAITPDHPWASRRLVVLVLPAFILLAVWALSWITARIRKHPSRLPAWLAYSMAAAGAAVLLVPTAVTAAGIMTYRMDIGSVAAMRDLCRTIPANGSVIIVDGGTGSNYAQAIRGMCGVPTATMKEPTPEAVDRVGAEIADSGQVMVLAGSERFQVAALTPVGIRPEHVVDIKTPQDPSTLMEPPSGSWAFDSDVWAAVVPSSRGGQ